MSQKKEALAETITSDIDDRIANSRYVGIIVDETTNITVEKMLITYLTLEQKGEPETAFIGNHAVPSGTAECITAKIKDVLSGRGVALYGSGCGTWKWSQCDGGSKGRSCTAVAPE